MIKLINGDCLEEMKNIKDGSVDMILCDLPYGMTKNKWDDTLPFDKLWEQYHRIIKDSGVIALFGSEPFSSYLRLSNIKNYRYDWIWEKTKTSGFLMAKKRPMKAHEEIMIFYKKLGTYNPIKTTVPKEKWDKRKTFTTFKSKGGCFGVKERQHSKEDGTRYPKSVQLFKSISNGVHPTQKPVELLEYLIKTYTNENELVLDNTMGSGSTGVAAVNTNRNFIGIELDKNYFEIAQQRIKEAQHDNL